MGHEKDGSVPKEGGWGWFVAIGMALMLTVATGPLGAFGFMFGEFLESLGEGTQGVTVISSVNFLCFSFTGLVTNYALRTFTCRQVCLFGSFLYVSGNLMTVFTTSVPQMLVTYGIIPGVGMGLMVPATFQSFNSYFVVRRTFVMSISQAITGAGCMVYPLLIELLMANYGFRGAQAIVSALALNTILASIVMKSAEKQVEKTDASHNSTSPEFTVDVYYSHENMNSSVDKKGALINDIINTQVTEGCELTTKDNGVNLSQSENHREDLIKQAEIKENTLEEGEPFLPPTEKTTTQDLTNVTSTKYDSTIPQANQTVVRKVFGTIVDFFDLTLLADPVYVNLVIGNCCAFFADITFFILLPLILFNMNFSKSATALCMSMGAGGDLLGRLFLIGLGLWLPTVSSRLLMWTGAFMSVIFRIAFTTVSSFVAVSVLTSLLGFFRAWIMVTGPLVFAEYNAVRFPSAFGLNMVINGLIAIVVGPLIGWIRDTTDSYVICTHALTALTTVCVLLWAVEAVIVRQKKIKPNLV